MKLCLIKIDGSEVSIHVSRGDDVFLCMARALVKLKEGQLAKEFICTKDVLDMMDEQAIVDKNVTLRTATAPPGVSFRDVPIRVVE